MDQLGNLSLIKSNRFQEGAILLFLAFIAFGSAYAYIHDFSFLRDDRSTQTEDSLADTVEVLNTVRLKKSGVVFWSSASAQQSLIRGDQLFTDNDSEVEIRFKGGTTIRIAENSLIRLDREDQEAGINLLQGQVLQADIKSENKKFSLKIGELEVKLSHGARFQAKADEGNRPQLLLESGTAAIVKDSKEANIIKSEAADVEVQTNEDVQAQVTTTSVLPLTRNGQQFQGFDQTVATLNWQADGQSQEFQVELSPLSTFTPSSIKIVQGNKTDFVLSQAGTYYWRVRPKQPDGSWGPSSIAQTISFAKRPQVEVLWPPASYTHRPGQDPDSDQGIIFSWTYLQTDQSSPALQTEWELSRDAQFTEKSTTKTTNKRQLRAELKEGRYYWRLRTQLGDGQVGPWIPTREIVVERSEPEIKAPPEPAPQDLADSGPVVEAAPPLPVVAKAETAPAIAQTETAAVMLPLEKQMPARPAPKEQIKKDFPSEPLQLAARPPQNQQQIPPPAAPDLKLSLPSQKIDLGKGVPLQITLKKVHAAKSYDIEISDQQSFDKTLHAKNTTERQMTRVLRGGQYFVRARAVSQAGTGDWSKTHSLQIPSWQSLAAPSLSLEKASTIYRQKPESVKLAFNLAEGKPKNFEIEMANTADFATGSGHKFTTKSGVFTLKPRFEQNYLRVRAIDSYGKAGEWSSASLFTATQTNEQPQLLSPSDKSQIQFSYLDKKAVEFRWTTAPDIDQQSIVIASDPKFETIVLEEKVKEPRYVAELDKDLNYYWQIKQTNTREKLKLESSVYSFKSSTLPVPPVDRKMFPHEIYGGYGFSMLDYKFESVDSSSEIGGSYANSIFLNYNYWFSDTFSFELDLVGHLISLTSLGEDNVEKNYNISFLDVSLLSRALWQLSREKGFYLEGLLGASTNTVPKIIAADDGSLTTKNYKPLHAWGGFGLLYAISQTVYLNTRLEGGIPVQIQQAKLQNGIYLKGTIRALQRLPRWNANLSYGLLGEYKKYGFDNNGTDEKLTHTLKGVQLGLGKDF